jgi:hypothetical protein
MNWQHRVASRGPSTIHCGKRNTPWTFQWGASAIYRNYDDPDPTIDQNNAEVDHVFWTRGGLVLPVGATWALVPQVEYLDQESN